MKDLILALNCVAPLCLVMCAGALIRCSRVFPEELFDQLSTLCFRFLIPCLLFCNIYSADLSKAASPALMAFLIGELLIWFLLNYILFTRLERNPRRRGVCIQAAYRSNIAVIGVTLARSMMGQNGVAAVTMAVAILVPTYNILAVITLETCRGGPISLGETLRGVLRNPLVISCALGVLALLFGIRIPEQILGSLEDLGSAGGTLTLVALGASLSLHGLRQQAGHLLRLSLYRLILAPLAALAAARLLGFRGDSLATVLVCTAAPMASSSFPMALVYDSDHELTGQLIVTTALFCPFTLFLWILLLRMVGLI